MNPTASLWHTLQLQGHTLRDEPLGLPLISRALASDPLVSVTRMPQNEMREGDKSWPASLPSGGWVTAWRLCARGRRPELGRLTSPRRLFHTQQACAPNSEQQQALRKYLPSNTATGQYEVKLYFVSKTHALCFILFAHVKAATCGYLSKC